MAKKRRRPRQRSAPRPPQGPGTDTSTDTADRTRSARAERKGAAREAREAELRRISRGQTIRRAAWFAGVFVVALGLFLYVTRVGGPKPIPASAFAAATAAGCGPVQTPTPVADAIGGQHLAPGAKYTYRQHPATSGWHDPSPLSPDPHVYDAPVPETRAVHNLEHAYVLIYYRADGSAALPQDVVSRLATLAKSQNKVIMAPYPDLPEGTSLALAAWDKLWECPATVTSGQAQAIASGFIHAYRGTSNAPEPRAA
jgi:hypothetical protein